MSHTTDQITPRGGLRRAVWEGMTEETYEAPSLICTACRGGVRADRNVQQPRAVMLLWAEDKIKREVEGVNILTVRMLLKAEQRTVSAILHAKSPAQTKEVLQAAYRRAGLVMHPPQQEAQRAPSQDGMRDIIQAIHNQTTITSQIAERLGASPTNQDFVPLLELVSSNMNMQQTIIEQTERIMVYLQAVHVPQVMEEFQARETPRRRHEEQTPIQDYSQQTDNSEVQQQTHPDEPEQQRPRQDMMPSPRREPTSFAPGGLCSNISQGSREASLRSQGAQGSGPATRPFRARQ